MSFFMTRTDFVIVFGIPSETTFKNFSISSEAAALVPAALILSFNKPSFFGRRTIFKFFGSSGAIVIV